MAKRVFICGILQESNSFTPKLASYEDFQTAGIFEGEELIHAGSKAGATMAGMMDRLKKTDFEVFGGVRMRSKSGGPVDHTVVDWFMDRTVKAIKAAGHLDGVVVSLHGATVSDTSDDVCGDVLETIRSLVGEETVVSASFDLHGNITERMAKAADFICGYQTYPHLDHYEVGVRAADLMIRKINGESLKMAYAQIPMMAPPHAYTTEAGELKELMQYAESLQSKGKIEDYTIFQVQPWMDIPVIASTVTVVAKDEKTACDVANELAEREYDLKEELQGETLYRISDVIEIARKNTVDKPVILVDSADSPNAGATGDSAAVLEELLPYRDELLSAVALNDQNAVEKAFQLGVGAKADFVLGGTLAPNLSKPVLVKDCVVKSLHTGDFIMGGPAERGQLRSIGESAVLQAGKIQILVSIRGQNNGDLQFYRGFGIEPTLCRLVDVKACTSFRAGYSPLSAQICNTATPGAAGCVLQEMPFTRLPEPMYPFQAIDRSMISKAVCYR